MIFAPFTGIDHHKNSVTFVVGLIANETIESFVWLFNAFMKAMGNYAPKIIITDQDPSMKIAFEKVFCNEETIHRLCMWHIMEKLLKKVESDLGEDTEFFTKFCSCVWSKEIEPEEFDKKWDSILSKYDLSENKWLQHMFTIKESWISAYYRDVPMSGTMRTTSRSESENNFINNFTTPHLTLFEFWMRYESAIDAQRHKQTRLTYDLRNSMSQRKTPLDLKIHTSEEFTHSIFYEFQTELVLACFHCNIQSMTNEEEFDNICIIDRKRFNKVFKVLYNKLEKNAHCPCKMLQREGIPCRHMLWVIKEKVMKYLPKGFIMNRWSKLALNKPLIDLGGNVIENFLQRDDLKKKVGDLWFEIFSCVKLVEQKEEYIEDFAQRIKSFKEELFSKDSHEKSINKGKEIETLIGRPIPSEVSVFNPNISNNKGRQKRTKQDKRKDGRGHGET
ncbi:protein FAR1-RELATED SEQUENCE 5-like [Beta vulgaris subsp. vulgaris]|uniref:protein FAR1-RELATED SEQUENCE 5-like n=1 Tax=Beta vulgaris subsp. vulgaris TaxID=3555 RepID=UPI0020374131|nr:protein FAR1-RELATED SEQUENCE 5-like [Beta vulgaris subsp. vulgaris]